MTSVRRAVEVDRRVTIDAIAKEIAISSAVSMPSEQRILGCLWLPHMLCPKLKAQRIDRMCYANLQNLLSTDRENFKRESLPEAKLESLYAILNPKFSQE